MKKQKTFQTCTNDKFYFVNAQSSVTNRLYTISNVLLLVPIKYTISERELRSRDCSSGSEALDLMHAPFYTNWPALDLSFSAFCNNTPIYGIFLVFFAICC